MFGATAASSLAACQSGSGTKQPAASPPAPAAGPAGSPPAAPIPSRTDAFIQRVFRDTSSTYVIGAAYIGDRLGLFKAMAGTGPMTAGQLAAKTKLDEEYVAEWLRTMGTSGYVDYKPAQVQEW